MLVGDKKKRKEKKAFGNIGSRCNDRGSGRAMRERGRGGFI